MPIKNVQFEFKAAATGQTLSPGEFLAYASVFGNVDAYGDRVVKGAFADTLKAWDSKDAVIPLLWGHDTSDPDHNIGHVASAAEDDHGLLVKGVIDMDGPKADQVYRLVTGKRVNQMSFAYDVLEDEMNDGVRDLKRLVLHEVSIVPLGANQETEILAVKARQLAKSGETMSDEAIALLRQASEALNSIIAANEDASGKSDDNENGADGDESEDQSVSPSVETWLRFIEMADLR